MIESGKIVLEEILWGHLIHLFVQIHEDLLLQCWGCGHCISMSCTEPLGNQTTKNESECQSAVCMQVVCEGAIDLLLSLLILYRIPHSCCSSTITSFHSLWCGLSYLGTKWYFTGMCNIFRTIQGPRSAAKMGNELLIRNVFFWSAQQSNWFLLNICHSLSCGKDHSQHSLQCSGRNHFP